MFFQTFWYSVCSANACSTKIHTYTANVSPLLLVIFTPPPHWVSETDAWAGTWID